FIINIFTFDELSTEEGFLHFIGQILFFRQLNQQMSFERISDFLLLKIEFYSGLFSGVVGVLVHQLCLAFRNAFYFGEKLERIALRLGFQLWIQLKTVPNQFYLISVWKLLHRFFQFFLANITEWASDVTPDIYFHIVYFSD